MKTLLLATFLGVTCHAYESVPERLDRLEEATEWNEILALTAQPGGGTGAPAQPVPRTQTTAELRAWVDATFPQPSVFDTTEPNFDTTEPEAK